MTDYTIIEDEEEVGYVTDEPEFDYQYGGRSGVVRRALREQDEAWDIDTGYGPGGASAEEMVEAEDSTKLERAITVIDSRSEVSLDPDPSLDPDQSDGEDDLGTQKADGDRVYVRNVHAAPDDKVVHNDEDGLFYYDEVDNPEPSEPDEPDEAEKAVGMLERFYDRVTGE